MTTTITGTITLPDGSTSQFECDGYGFKQWAADRQRLGRTVDVVEAINEAVREYHPVPDEDDPDEDDDNQDEIDRSIAEHERALAEQEEA